MKTVITIVLLSFAATPLLARAADDAKAKAESKANADDHVAKAAEALRGREFKQAADYATEALKADADHAVATYYRAVAYDQLKEYEKAIKDYTRFMKLDEKAALSPRVRADDRRGDCLLKVGRMKEAIADFDAYLKRHPDAEPYHWRRGIAFYYGKAYKRGVAQFETHKTVNAADVENSVWHFLCNAPLVGVDKARAALIPLEGKDSRVPMMTVYEMFAGRATPKDVLAKAEAAKPGGRQSEPALFYAHLYIGLYHEAMGKHDLARKHLQLAATKHTSPYYMGDVARVHVKLLDQAKEKE